MSSLGYPVITHVAWNSDKPTTYMNIWNKELKEMLKYISDNSLAYQTFIKNLKQKV